MMFDRRLFRFLCPRQPPSNGHSVEIAIPKSRRLLLGVLRACTVLLGLAGGSIPAVTLIESCDDATLRAALEVGGEITFACDGNIVLTNTLLVSSHTTLNANGHDVSLDGNQSIRIMEVASNNTLRVQGIRFVGGLSKGKDGVEANPLGEDGLGGAILSRGVHLHITDCSFTNNVATGGDTDRVAGDGGHGLGGAIHQAGGALSATNCLFVANETLGGVGYTDNTATFGGGGRVRGGAVFGTNTSLVFDRCAFQRNRIRGGQGYSFVSFVATGGESSGGAVYADQSVVSMSGCELLENSSLSGIGGYEDGTAGQALGGACTFNQSASTIMSTKFSQNTSQCADGIGFFPTLLSPQGGAIAVLGGTCQMQTIHCTSNKTMGGWVSRGWCDPAKGGAIYNTGDTSINSSIFMGNMARMGQGRIGRGRSSEGRGGAIYNAGQCHVRKTQFSGNEAKGGDHYTAPELMFENPAAFCHGQGGAAYNEGTLTVIQSSFVDNLARGGIGNTDATWGLVPGGHGMGGAVYNAGQFSTINTTFFHNLAIGGGRQSLLSSDSFCSLPGDGLGGAIYQLAGSGNFLHVTFDHNQALPGLEMDCRNFDFELTNHVGQALGDTLFSTNSVTVLSHTILNGGGTNGVCYGTVQDDGYNICSDETCHFTVTGSLNNTDAGLAGSEAQAGFPRWIPLLPDSVAIDAGAPSNCITVDQRGVTRPSGDACDPGAYEWFESWSIGGAIVGPGGQNVLVEVGPFMALTDEQGHYFVDGMEDGTYEVHPVPWVETVIPNARTVSVGPDALSVDFRLLALNTLAAVWEADEIQYYYKGSPLRNITLMSSTNLSTWQDERGMTLDGTGLYRWSGQPSAEDPIRFYQIRTP